ncbi:endonuclease/exonuclease/phosphatase family protein [Robertkochia aurantiaca]|uniref:endonuclease/exonuclease/phosphatase family protein n=1 Tax=Robertkochia aurantiaca TaxID=2873700 RepID=UPI001CCE1D8D|nr:endonuclease/exonuclease/phosphatase family protein [Robertkochia sp. 3YJGBD-33]
MKKLNWFQKGIFLMNVVFAVLLVLGLLMPYFSIKLFPKLSVFSLIVPVLLVGNLLFFFYWIINLKRQMWLSFVVLLCGFGALTSLYRFSGTEEVITNSAVKVMSYNVRIFDHYEWIKDQQTEEKIIELIREEDPDILCIQEYHENKNGNDLYRMYPHRYIEMKHKGLGQAIFSKYPITGKGSLDFPNSGNNAIYADLVLDYDTLRVYNLHLQSFQINPEKEEFTQENSNRLLNRMGKAFSMQQFQTDIFVKHRDQSPYKTISCGDLNNNQFSAIYHQVKGSGKDTFEEEGTGTGKTYYFRYFPLRIDFIFTGEEIEVISHKNRYEFLSDHYPVISQIKVH